MLFFLLILGRDGRSSTNTVHGITSINTIHPDDTAVYQGTVVAATPFAPTPEASNAHPLTHSPTRRTPHPPFCCCSNRPPILCMRASPFSSVNRRHCAHAFDLPSTSSGGYLEQLARGLAGKSPQQYTHSATYCPC